MNSDGTVDCLCRNKTVCTMYEYSRIYNKIVYHFVFFFIAKCGSPIFRALYHYYLLINWRQSDIFAYGSDGKADLKKAAKWA